MDTRGGKAVSRSQQVVLAGRKGLFRRDEDQPVGTERAAQCQEGQEAQRPQGLKGRAWNLEGWARETLHHQFPYPAGR